MPFVSEERVSGQAMSESEKDRIALMVLDLVQEVRRQCGERNAPPLPQESTGVRVHPRDAHFVLRRSA